MKNLDTATLRKANDYAVYRIFPLYKYVWLLIAFGLTGVTLQAQTTLWTESFETDGNGTRYSTSISEFVMGGDFFTRTDGSNLPSNYSIGSPDGSFYWAAADIDGQGATLPVSLTISGINISGYSNLQFSGLFAEDDDGNNQDWDEPDYVHIFYSIDGGSEQNLLWIENDGSTFNSAPFVDTDFDGTGDGTEITSTFAQLSAAIMGTGSLLDIRIEFFLDSGDEDFAVDNFMITGTNPVIGVAKNASVSGTQVTLDFYLENIGDAPLSNLSLPDDLDAVFGAGNYSISSVPAFIDDPGTITLNGSYDGSTVTELISSGTLAVGETAQIQMIVDITTVTDQGSGLGVYANQVTATAEGPGGGMTSDPSDGGTDPDPNGNNEPNEIGENDATPITVAPTGGSITIVKTANPTSAGTNFSFSGDLGSFSLNGSNDGTGNEYTASNVTPGTYTITEDALSGWVLTGIQTAGDTDGGSSIDFDAGSITVDVDAGEDITVTFVNAATYELRMIKYNDLDEDGTNNEINTSGVQNTSGNALTGWEFVIYDSQGNEVGRDTTSVENPGANGDLGIRASIPGLISGAEYTICETQQNGWINTEPSNGVDNSTYGEPCETVTLTSSTNVTRYFGNYQETGSITILKNVDNDFFNDLEFDFMFNGSTPFTLSENGDDFVVMDLPAGNYEVTEMVPANWDLVSISCNNPNNNTGTTNGLTIVLEPGENEVCTFNNNYTGETGNITIRKDVDDNSFADMNFDFMFNGDTPFTLSENGSAFVLENIPVGNYPVTEMVPANWDLVSISCNNPNNNTGTTNGLTIVLDANEDADCTFNNEFCPAPTLVSESFDPNTGQLTLVFESSIAAGIENINFTVLNNLIVQSSDGFTSAGGNEYNWNTPNPPTTATFVLVPAAADPSLSFGYSVNVTNECGSVGTFDAVFGSIKVVKFNDLDENGEQDNGEPFLTGWEFTLSDNDGVVATGDTDSDGCVTFSGLPLGSYEICETLQNGWTNSTPLCQTVELTVDAPLPTANSEPGGATYVAQHVNGSPDPATGLNGVKWELSDNFDNTGGTEDDEGTFSITFDVAYEPVTVAMAVASGGPSGGQTGQSSITGPSCTVRDETTELPADNNAVTITTGNGDSFDMQFLGTTNNGLTWNYNVTELNDRSLMHWVLGIESCIPEAMVSFGNFQNTGSLEVTKVVNWSGVPSNTNQTFEICIIGPSYPNGNEQGACQMADSDGGTLTWNDLLSGEYIVTETDPGAEWSVEIIGSPVDVMPGATATATVTNTLIPATLTIVKEVVVGDNATVFDFGLFGPDVISNSNQQQFTLTDGNQRVFDPLRPGNYAIAEYFETGWRNIRAEDIVCVDGNGNDLSVDYDSDNTNMRAGVLFTLGGGDDVTCTFTNLQCPTVEAGENQTICLTKSATLTGASFGASATEATWSIISEPEPGAGTLSETGATNTPAMVTFSATEPGTYVLQLTTDAPDGCDPATDTVTIEVLNVNCGEFPWRGNE